MTDNGSLNWRQRRFVVALMTTSTIEAAAQAAGIGERTAYRYLRDPAVKAMLAQALDDLQGQATRRVVGEMTAALETLADIHADDEAPTGARVSAARAILDAGPKLRESLDLAERLAELERSLNDGQ